MFVWITNDFLQYSGGANIRFSRFEAAHADRRTQKHMGSFVVTGGFALNVFVSVPIRQFAPPPRFEIEHKTPTRW